MDGYKKKASVNGLTLAMDQFGGHWVEVVELLRSLNRIPSLLDRPATCDATYGKAECRYT